MKLLSFVLLVLVMLDVSRAADIPSAPANDIRLEQSLFTSSVEKEQVMEKMLFASRDGQAAGLGSLPEHTRKVIVRLTAQSIPHIEFRDADPREVMGFLASAGNVSKPTIRLGEVITQKTQPAEWLSAIDVGDKKVSCTLTNVSLLELSTKLAESLDQEVGILDDGKMVFGKSGKWVPGFTPIYTIKGR